MEAVIGFTGVGGGSGQSPHFLLQCPIGLHATILWLRHEMHEMPLVHHLEYAVRDQCLDSEV